MITPEANRTQRLLALFTLGVCDALSENAISNTEAERLLFSPRTMRNCKSMGLSAEAIKMIHIGTELDSISRMVGYEEWSASINSMRKIARDVLVATQESSSQLDNWFDKLVST